MSDPIILEVPITDPSNVPFCLTGEQALIDLIKVVIINEDIKNKISIKLTSEIINLINNIMSLSPGSLSDIEKSIKDVIKDGKIDTNDIPNFIVLIQLVYRIIYSIKNTKFDNKKTADATSIVLKFIIHLLVLERKIEIPQEKQIDFLSSIDMLIDNCCELLSLSKLIKTKGCMKKFFG